MWASAVRMPPLAVRARLTAGVAALAVGARLATDVVVLGSSAGARLATLDAAALGAYAPTRFAALGLATEAVAPGSSAVPLAAGDARSPSAPSP